MDSLGVTVAVYEHNDFLLTKVRVEVESYDLWRTEPPKQESCPAVFRCYCCQRKRPEKEYGGSRRGKRFCLSCIPYLDDFDAGRMIWRDKILGFEKEPPSKPQKSEKSVPCYSKETLEAAQRLEELKRKAPTAK